MSVPNRSFCSTLKGWKWGYLVSDKKKLQPREFPWQHHHHLVSFVMVSFLMPSLKNTAFPEIFFIQRYSLFSILDIQIFFFIQYFTKPHDVITYLIYKSTAKMRNWKSSCSVCGIINSVCILLTWKTGCDISIWQPVPPAGGLVK